MNIIQLTPPCVCTLHMEEYVFRPVANPDPWTVPVMSNTAAVSLSKLLDDCLV